MLHFLLYEKFYACLQNLNITYFMLYYGINKKLIFFKILSYIIMNLCVKQLWNYVFTNTNSMLYLHLN